MAKKRKARVFYGPSPWILIILFGLFFGIITTLLAVFRVTPGPGRAASCDDAGCQNVRWQRNPPIWQLTNCDPQVLVCDPDGDQQICTRKRIGMCGGQSYCCPASGAQWTTNMSGCAGVAPYTNECIPSPTPTATPTPTPEPTDTPTPTPTPEPTHTPTPTPKPYIYYEPATPTPTRTPTPTPTSYILNSCNKACTTNKDCPGGLTCATAFGQKVCRNPLCSDQFSCLCNQGSFANLFLTPTPAEGGLGSTQQVAISVSSFTDSKGNANSTPTITGLSEPGALITVSIFPDGVSGTVTADASGRWSWRATKALTAGQKSLLVVTKNADGAQGQVNQTFTVAATKSMNLWGLLIPLLVIIAIAFGVYVWYKSNNP